MIRRSCDRCPTFALALPSLATLSPATLQQAVVVPQWGMAPDLRREKDIHCLHPVTFTVSEAFKELGKQADKMVTHLFKMTHQWEALAKAKAALKPYHVIIEIDYQVAELGVVVMVEVALVVVEVVVLAVMVMVVVVVMVVLTWWPA